MENQEYKQFMIVLYKLQDHENKTVSRLAKSLFKTLEKLFWDKAEQEKKISIDF